MRITLSQFGNPPADKVENANYTIGILHAIDDYFPNQFRFNSGYRTPQHNAAVGGVFGSYHVQALAGDITPLNGDYDYYKAALQSIVAPYGYEVIDERNKNHFHIEPAPSWSGINEKPSNANPTAQNNYLIYGIGALLIYLLLGD